LEYYENLFAKSNEGKLHLVNIINNEFTLCGHSWEGDGRDIDSSNPELDPNAWEQTTENKLTCDECIEIVNYCKQVKIKGI